MQRLALLICLFLGAAFLLMPQASGAAVHDVQAQALRSGAQGMMPGPARCPDCDPLHHDDAQHSCPTMGAGCGAMTGCGVAITGLTLAPMAVLPPRDLPVQPALSRVRAQRALVPEPPPPRL